MRSLPLKALLCFSLFSFNTTSQAGIRNLVTEYPIWTASSAASFAAVVGGIALIIDGSRRPKQHDGYTCSNDALLRKHFHAYCCPVKTGNQTGACVEQKKVDFFTCPSALPADRCTHQTVNGTYAFDATPRRIKGAGTDEWMWGTIIAAAGAVGMGAALWMRPSETSNEFTSF